MITSATIADAECVRDASHVSKIIFFALTSNSCTERTQSALRD